MVWQADLDALRQIPLIAELRPEDLARIGAATIVRRYRRGDIIMAKGEQGGPLRYVRSGVVKLFSNSMDGKEQVLRLVASGHTFNTVAAVDGRPSPVSAAAVEPSVVYAIRGTELRKLVAERPEVARAAMLTFTSALRELVALTEDLSLHHVSGRVAKLLLDQERCTCERCRAHRLTQQEISAVVGTAREVVGRILRDMQAAGIIQVRRGCVVLLDHERLRSLAR